MPTTRMVRRGALVFALALVGTALGGTAPFGGTPADATGQSGTTGPGAGGSRGAGTVAVYVAKEGGPVTASAVRSSDARLVADYGSYALWRVPAASAEAVVAAGATPAGDIDHLNLRGRVIDTATGREPSVRPGLRRARAGAKALGLVQFAGPPLRPWLDALRARGLSVVAPVPPNGFVVHGSAKTVAALNGNATTDPSISYTGPFRPAYRLSPALVERAAAGGRTPVEVTVQVVAGEATDIEAVRAAGTLLSPPETVDAVGLTNLRLRTTGSQLDVLASLPSVLNVEPYVAPTINDESQGQVLARNISQIGGKWVPSGPGYLSFLSGKGVSTNPNDHPMVTVVDDGVDNGTSTPLHPDFYRNGSTADTSRIAGNFDCTTSGSPKGSDGHGNINAGIIGGFNNGTGFPREDAAGYNFGLGIDPYARLSNVKIFGPAYNLTNCANTESGITGRAVTMGARITSNSWGANVAGAYDASAQHYDALTRDASVSQGGAQPVLHVFSAGNAGPDLTTIGSPGTAKNVLTVGATEGVRDQGTADGCAISTADNADDMAGFSSRGPTADLRNKPDIVAPGTHIQGPASQDPSYNGSGVCGPKYYPTGQTLYTWSSGTSHSAPAVSGAAALAWEYYRRVVNPGVDPSPAMLKAMLLNTPRYLDGAGTGGTLPGVGQGWGGMDLAALFDPGRFAYDQATTFSVPGQTFTRYFNVTASAKPTRITMAFSDAPGSTVGDSYVNDLDLVVVAGGRRFLGNVFSGASSAPGGSGDTRNNVEQVFLPAGVGGVVAVQVVARTIVGNGVPGGSIADQDFALTTVNLTPAAVAPTVVPYLTGVFASDVGSGNNGNGAVEPGEMPRISVVYGNLGTGSAPVGTVTISKPSGSPIDIVSASRPTISLGTGLESTADPFILRYRESADCAGTFTLTAKYVTGGKTASATFTVATGAGGPLTTLTSANVPRTIPDNNPGGVASTLTSGVRGVLSQVTLSATHTWDGDLEFRLTSPSGVTAVLVNRRGSNGDNFTSTVFDDTAATAVGAGSAPFTGSFRPEEPLATLTGTTIGTWTLKGIDWQGGDVGAFTAWGIKLRTCAPAPTAVAVANAPGVLEGTGPGTTPMTFTILRSGPTTAALSVPVFTADGTAVAGSDYLSASGTATMAVGQAETTFVVSVKHDGVLEPNENLKLVIGASPPGVPKVRGTATGTIRNDD